MLFFVSWSSFCALSLLSVPLLREPLAVQSLEERRELDERSQLRVREREPEKTEAKESDRWRRNYFSFFFSLSSTSALLSSHFFSLSLYLSLSPLSRAIAPAPCSLINSHNAVFSPVGPARQRDDAPGRCETPAPRPTDATSSSTTAFAFGDFDDDVDAGHLGPLGQRQKAQRRQAGGCRRVHRD
jgi:hypothetical protein